MCLGVASGAGSPGSKGDKMTHVFQFQRKIQGACAAILLSMGCGLMAPSSWGSPFSESEFVKDELKALRSNHDLELRMLARRLVDPQVWAQRAQGQVATADNKGSVNITDEDLDHLKSWINGVQTVYKQFNLRLPGVEDLKILHRVTNAHGNQSQLGIVRNHGDIAPVAVGYSQALSEVLNSNTRLITRQIDSPQGTWLQVHYPPSHRVPYYLNLAFKSMTSQAQQLKVQQSNMAPIEYRAAVFELAAQFQVELSSLHPFWLGNDTAIKLVRDWVIQHFGFAPPAFSTQHPCAQDPVTLARDLSDASQETGILRQALSMNRNAGSEDCSRALNTQTPWTSASKRNP